MLTVVSNGLSFSLKVLHGQLLNHTPDLRIIQLFWRLLPIIRLLFKGPTYFVIKSLLSFIFRKSIYFDRYCFDSLRVSLVFTLSLLGLWQTKLILLKLFLILKHISQYIIMVIWQYLTSLWVNKILANQTMAFIA